MHFSGGGATSSPSKTIEFFRFAKVEQGRDLYWPGTAGYSSRESKPSARPRGGPPSAKAYYAIWGVFFHTSMGFFCKI